MSSRVSVALFGAYRGMVGRLAQLAHNKEVSIPWVVDIDPESAGQIAEAFPDKPEIVKPAYSQLPLEDPNVDAIILCVPQVNVNMVRRALNHGKGVFTAAPFYREVGAILACDEEAVGTGKPFFCHLNRRFDTTLRHLRKKIRSGKVGNIQTLKLNASYGPFTAFTGAGSQQQQQHSVSLFHDCAVNELDLVCWLLDQDPETVFAQVGANTWQSPDLKDQDSAAIVLQFPKGVMATIDVRKAALSGESRVEVYGTKGLVTIDQNDTGTAVAYMTGRGAKNQVDRFSLEQQQANSLMASLRHFMSVLKGEEKAEISLTDKLRASLLASACQDSQANNSVVTLSLDFLRNPEKLSRPIWQERPDIPY